MACRDKEKFITAEASSKARLRTIGAIDKFLNITNLNLFREMNTQWSKSAKERFGVTERLFFEDGTKAVPNKVAFKTIDNAKGINYQLEEINMSKAAPETLAKVKAAAEKMGISIQALSDYAKATGLDTKSVNGVADLVKGIVAVAQGREDVALTEEMVHLATAILEQTNPKMVTEMIAKIDKFKIYKLTLDAYKGNKNYQTADGKPDIRKIKKEAVDKLIAELIVRNSEGSTEFPELLQEETRSFVRKMWDAVLEFLRIAYRKSNIDIFEEAAKQVISGEVGARYYGKAKEGVEDIFNDNPELAKIGTPEQYSAYLDSIFPDSKVKEIVYHGTSTEFTKFEIEKLGLANIGSHKLGVSFSNDADVAFSFAESSAGDYIYLSKDQRLKEIENYKRQLTKELSDEDRSEILKHIHHLENFKLRIIPSVLNLKNPIIGNEKSVKKAIDNKVPNDGIVVTDTSDDAYNWIVGVNAPIEGRNEYIVPSNEQIHTLGSNQDIEGFKNFMKTAPVGFTGKGTFFQTTNTAVDNVYNTVVSYDKRLELIPESATGEKRHYTFDLNKVARSVTEKVKARIGRKLPDRSETQKITDEQKREWGTEGHTFLEQYITNCLIDKDGYKRAQILDVPMTSRLTEKQQKELRAFAIELINSYKEGTRFIIERKVINTKEKGMLASTVDFIAIEPDEKTGVKVDILDWKFTSIDKSRESDIPWFKQKEWKGQMGEYAKILYQYGVKPNQIRKTRMIPFIINYKYRVAGDSASGLVADSMEIGKLDSLTETNLYLLPVPLNSETTGNEKIDKLVDALREQWEKLYKKPVAPSERYAKIEQMNQLSVAIRSLHMKLDFKPLVLVGRSFLQNAAVSISKFEHLDYTKMSKDEIKKKLGDLLEYKKSAEKFADLDDVFLSHISKDGISKEDRDVLTELERISARTGRMFEKISELQTEYAIQIALKEGITLDVVETESGRKIQPEVAVSGFAKTFLEGSKLSAKLVKLVSNLIMNARSLTNLKMRKMIDEFEKVLIPLEKEARAKGVKAFDLIGTMDDKGLHLIKKLDSKFKKDIQKARENKDLEFFKKNMDVDKYNELAKEAIKKGEEELDNIVFSTNETDDIEKRVYRKKLLRDSLDINRPTFNGYEGFYFNSIFNQVVKEEGHYSKEYLAMSEDARKVWNYFTALNKRAKEMGYLEREGSSFFPLIEATILEKVFQTGDVLGQTKDFFGDLYRVKVDEEQSYSKIDPETGQLKKQIPRYFRRMDENKSVQQLSKDLSKVGTMWIKSLLEYESARDLENVLLTLHSVEQAKGSLMLDENGKVIMEAGVPKVDERTNKNAQIIDTIINDFIYHLNEDVSSLGNIGISNLTDKFTNDDEQKAKAVVSIKKGMRNADTLVRALAVGLKPLIGLANWAGTQFQSYISAGGMYRFRDYEKNNIKVTTGVGLTTIEKALLDFIVPLNEDVATEKRRRMLAKQSYLDYLGSWTFSDVMMVTNSFPERKLQFANALSFNENSMVLDGKIVNIRQHLKAQDAKNKYKLSFEERRALEKSFEARVKELQETSALTKIAKIENDELVIPGVELEEIAKYRTKIIEYARNLNGQLSQENRAGYRRDSIFTSFMMFKTWIPKLVSVRAIDINKNVELDQWEYGRMRVFIKTWAHLGMRNITNMRDILLGNEKGLAILNEMLEAKRADYFKKTGQILEITEEEFYDLIRTELQNELKELKLLFSLVGLIIAAKVAEPPEDATDLEKNRYKFWAKAINKISDEISFYYNPTSAEAISRGSIVPALGLLSKAEKIILSLGKEVVGYTTDDEEMLKKAYPLKYFLNIIPGAAQFQTEILPYIDPELAKQMGIRVTTQARRN